MQPPPPDSSQQESREVDFNASRITENTRASYPIEYICEWAGWLFRGKLGIEAGKGGGRSH